MVALKHLPLQALAALACALSLSGCVPPPQRSNIAETLDNTSFAPPPGSPSSFGTPARPGSGLVSAPPGGLGPDTPISAQVYPGRSFAPRPAASAERSGDGVQLNFDRAEIREVARVVLGDILGASYTVNADVQGEVTLSSGAPLSEQDLLAVLEAALRSSGASLVETGPNTYQIMTADTAIGRSDIVPMGGGRPVQVRPGYGITIIPLRNISATAAAQFIQPLVATPEDIRIDPGRNAILFSGTAAERQNVIDTVRDLDVDWMAGKSIGLFPLERASPEAIIPELQAIFAPFDPTGAEPSLIRFLPIARLNAVLAIGGDADQIREVDGWVTRLDRGDTVGTQFYVYYLKHAAAEDVAKLLNETYADSGGGGTAPGPTLGSATTALGGNQDGGTGADDLGGAPPSEPGGGFGAAPAPAEPTAPDGPIKVVASRPNNALLIKATPEIYESMEATLLRLDTAPSQVLIEATIAEITLNDQLRYGVQYFLESGSFASGLVNAAQASLIPNTITPGFNFLFTPRGSAITIDALSRITDVRVLSSPSVVVLDNSEAELVVGDEVPIVTRQATGVIDPDSPTVNSIEYRDTGVILQVRPRINSNGAVSLEIAQEVSRVSDPNAVDELTPTITQRKINSRVSVQSGQTVVLGGLIQDSETRGRDRIPVLGEIPVLGSLFGSTSTQDQRTELIVFITPRVINNPDDARDVSDELRSRLRSLSPSRALSPMTQAVPPALPAPPRNPPPPPSRTTPRPIVPQAGGPAPSRPSG